MAKPKPGVQKVFGVGFHKTGTTSLARALSILGYRVTGPNGVEDPTIGERALELAMHLVPQFDAFQDNPWPILFREMDERFPGSKFILTLRDPGPWYESVLRHFGQETTPMREWIYEGHGSPVGNKDVYMRRFMRHNSEVLGYFRERPEDLLVMNITEGVGWGLLCPFLGKRVPDQDFPHQNRAGAREKSETGQPGRLRQTANRLKRMLLSSDRRGW